MAVGEEMIENPGLRMGCWWGKGQCGEEGWTDEEAGQQGSKTMEMGWAALEVHQEMAWGMASRRGREAVPSGQALEVGGLKLTEARWGHGQGPVAE